MTVRRNRESNSKLASHERLSGAGVTATGVAVRRSNEASVRLVSIAAVLAQEFNQDVFDADMPEFERAGSVQAEG